ncbi:hypothetical protein J5N97_025234 [Dioscorea zingiberensis]|uniref:Uncharacterized protein n=1 Tax=Dioscorea zingiberensis TaxID=325984 RepID=A0A9D5C7X4_9LILI|nr:hypothetical protein J5N97_025234 [Dioscorea zingiberensis]
MVNTLTANPSLLSLLASSAPPPIAIVALVSPLSLSSLLISFFVLDPLDQFVMASGDDFAYHEWLKKGASRSGSQGGSPDRASAGSGPKRSSVSSGRARGSSSSARKEFLRKFIDCEILTENLEDWFSGSCEESAFRKPVFDVPFELTALQSFDYALEDVSFQQLIRMPNALYASTSDAVEATAHLAIEDFLHASVKGLWETFWGQDVPMPFSVACIHSNELQILSSWRGQLPVES